MAHAALNALAGTTWSGNSELWLDPLGNEAKLSECSISVDDGAIAYSWAYEGKPQQGRIALRDGGATWTDSWHQPKEMECSEVAGSWALLDVTGSYGAGEGPDWGWRTTLAQRPSGELVLLMDNIAPWGERTRAVRMVFARP